MRRDAQPNPKTKRRAEPPSSTRRRANLLNDFGADPFAGLAADLSANAPNRNPE
jgi:hypothetical protein